MSSDLSQSNAQFWLPPEFLTDDDILMDFKPKPLKKEVTNSVLHFPFNNPHSGLSSPVESVVSEESEEEEYLAGLTRKMAESSLIEDLWKTDTQKNWGISVSPQSTLCGCKHGSSRGSPNCPSPPGFTSADQKDVGWDLLYQAAGEVARMRMIEDASSFYSQNRGLNPNLGFQSNHGLSYQQLQLAKFQQLKTEQLLLQLQAMQQARQVVPPRANSINRQPANISTGAWPTLQQSVQPQAQQQQATTGTGMRAVYLGNTLPRRESVGTGVFLPRRPGTTNVDPPKKSGGSTVLLPDRVVQALNLNLEPTNLGGAVNLRNNVQASQNQKSYVRAPATVAHSDLRLPQEWTY